MKPYIVYLAAFFVSLLSASAEPVKLSRSDASALYVALSSMEAGLNPSNSVIAADNITALRPVVEALDKGKTAYQRGLMELNRKKPADMEDRALKLADQLEASAAEEVTVDLTRITISDDELKESKLRPGHLSTIRRFLKPVTNTK